MRILFVYPGYIVREVPLNVMYVSAHLKEKGHDTKLFHFSSFKNPKWLRSTQQIIIKEFRKEIVRFNPSIVAFSVMAQNYHLTQILSNIAKKDYNKIILWGGIEPILEPERCISESFVDYICTGEGENVVPELIHRIESNESEIYIPGIWYKSSPGNFVITGRPPLIENLDTLVFPDRDLLPPEYYRAELTGANILTARGCPFPCTHCQNKYLMQAYKGLGPFVRTRSLDNIFEEMEELIRKYDTPSFYMSDEIFTLNRNRVIDFCTKYQQRIGRPFMVQTRVDCMDNDIAKMLSNAGCFMVNLAIESGNDHLRCDVIKKNINKEQIKNAFYYVRKNGMLSTSFNMIGIPGETRATIFDTINLNRELKPDRILCTIYMPLPKTELGELSQQLGLIDGSVYHTTNYYNEVIIKNPSLSKRDLIGYQGLFDFYVYLPTIFYPIIDLFRKFYQSIVNPGTPSFQIGIKIRYLVVDFIYRSKKHIPGRDFHVKNR